MRTFTLPEFTSLVQSIQEHAYRLPSETDAEPARSHKFSAEKPADDRFYLINGRRTYEVVAEALKKKFPHLDKTEVTMFCDGVPGYLERTCVMLEYIENKIARDYFIQKIITPDERDLLETSITRASNMATILRTIEAVFTDYPEERTYFTSIETSIKRIYASQRHQTDEVMKLLNAKNVRKIVYDFCVTLIQENH